MGLFDYLFTSVIGYAINKDIKKDEDLKKKIQEYEDNIDRHIKKINEIRIASGREPITRKDLMKGSVIELRKKLGYK
ncbi:MAG: hypothetical protein AAB071_03880 [Bacteroidota bacterium]